MTNRGIILGFLSMGALFFVVGPRGSSAPVSVVARDSAVRPVPVPPAGPKEASRGFRLIEQFLGTVRDSVKPGQWPKVEALIATAADPYDSHLDWSFDAVQEAIRRAFETSGYVLNRFWLPDSKALVVDPVTKESDAARTRYPGVLLFSKTDTLGIPSLFLVYLVGETPTAGIHREAFRAALREHDALIAAPAASDTTAPLLRIVGPTFSGSTASLRRLLDEWTASHPDRRRIQVISGSATSVNRGLLTGGRISFHATVQSDPSFLKALDSVGTMLGIEPREVAVLTEGSTEYGHKVGNPARAGGDFLNIPFPMNISSLREEYERHPDITEAQHLTLSQSQAPRTALSLEEDHHTNESPPATSRLSVPAVEQMVGQMVRTLSQHDIRMVALLATDVRDKLFLAGEIRKKLREVQLVTFESNVLYLRPDRYRSLHGMIVLSTYPLILENQRWTWPDTTAGLPLMPFANEGAEGVYNAVLLQLGQTDKLVDYQSPADTAHILRPPVWVSAVGSASFVPLTFLAGYTDTSYVQGGAANHRLDGKSSYRPAQMSYAQKAVVVVLALVLLIVAIRRLLILAGLRPRASGLGGWPKGTEALGEFPCSEYDSVRAQVECSSLTVHEHFYAAVQMVGLLGVCLPAAAIYLAMGSGNGGAQTVAWVSFFLVIGCAGAAFLLSAWKTIRSLISTGGGDIKLLMASLGTPERWSWPLEVASRYLVAFLTLVYLYLILRISGTILGMGGEHTPRAWLFFVRAIQIDGELSPLPPLLLSALALAWWATWHLKRVDLLRQQTAYELLFSVPRSAPGTELVGLQRTVRETHERLFMMVPGVSGMLIGLWLILVVATLIAMFEPSIEQSLLGTMSFDILLKGGIVATLIAIPWGVCRLFVTWRALRAHLEELRCLPIVTAFDRLPPRIARLTGFSVVMGNSRHVIDAVTRTQWLELRNFTAHRLTTPPKQDDPPLGDPALLAEIDTCMAGLKADQATDTIEAHELRLRKVYPVLRSAWNAEPQGAEIGVIERVVAGPDASSDPDMASTASKIRRTFASPARVWVRLAEEYFAVQNVGYIEGVFQHLRRLGLFLLVSLLLSTALLSSYPFYPKARVELVFLALMVAAVTTVIAMMVQMNKDEVLSRISKSDPGRLNWDMTFVLNLVLFGVIPLLSLLATEFPGIRSFLGGWLEPFARAMGKIT